jgi:3-oxoacyl-[acyl-carrier protein] reductase
MMVAKGLSGQSAIVTGGARGIGLGIARRLSAEGVRVAVWDQNLAALDASPDYRPDFAQTVDVTDLGAVQHAFTATEEAFGDIHIFVNNAGVNGPVLEVDQYPPEDWHRVIAVDLTGVFYCCKVVVPHMKARGYGRIVTIASIAGKEGMPGISAYSAAKHGAIGLCKSLARELVGTGVLVNCLAPVITETDLLKEHTPEFTEYAKSRIPMGRFAKVEEIAAMTAWVASPECSFTTGMVFDVSGGRADY